MRSGSILFVCLAILTVPGLGQIARAESRNTGKTAAPPPQDLRRLQEQLKLENGVAEQELKKELRELVRQKQRQDLETAIAREKLKAGMMARQAEMERLTKEVELTSKRLALKDAERKSELSFKEHEVRLRTAQSNLRRIHYETEVAKLRAEIDLREKRDEWLHRVQEDIRYTKEPFKKGVLTVSDRRIALNGVITMRTADHISERVNYFNNLSREYPIFIVIDESPGGSVAAGYKILKTMKGSYAPVYVVVKSFAASMAAGITTLAARSFAYPNAILLHHQILSLSMGNLTQQKERLKDMDEFWRRLAGPIAKKMGSGLDAFIKRMYQNRSTGDWMEFADRAQKLRWVDEIVEVVHEESYLKHPDKHPPIAKSPPHTRRGSSDELTEEVDAQKRAFVTLPRLSPVDFYYLYNPDNYYRLAP